MHTIYYTVHVVYTTRKVHQSRGSSPNYYVVLTNILTNQRFFLYQKRLNWCNATSKKTINMLKVFHIQYNLSLKKI
jgi:hypothetical protein